MNEVYKSSGKTYNGEKGIISLTSWKARIKTVSKTLYSLIKQCPGFHIVLVLSEEEFPKKEAELPENLMLFVNSNLIELLWVYKNYKSFKKVLFTMDKYRDVPIISADDDCIYKFNYAEKLYTQWVKNKNACISFYRALYKDYPHTAGYATLHPPYCYGNILDLLDYPKLNLCEDDNFYTAIRYVKNLKSCITLKLPMKNVAWVHDEKEPLHEIYGKNSVTIFNKKMDELIKLVRVHFKVVS